MKQVKTAESTMSRYTKAALVFLLSLTANFALAAGGLDEATSQLEEIKDWAYGFLGIGVFVYLIYLVVMALLDRKQWADVLVGVGYVALAGGIIVGGEWAWSIWGS